MREPRNSPDEPAPERRFSIVVACYNQRSFVQAAVRSALDQVHPAREVIVVDDGSSDGTQDVLDAFGDSIRLVKLPKNEGANPARNHGSKLATGDYIVFLDGDDILMPWALQAYERLVNERNPKLILSRSVWFQGEPPTVETPRKLEFAEYPYLFQKDRGTGYAASIFVIDRRMFWDVGGWTPDSFPMDVIDLCTKLGVQGKAVLLQTPATTWYRMHGVNTIRKVPPFLRETYVMLKKERASQYPHSKESRLERSAWFGQIVAYWVQTAARSGLYSQAVRLAWSGMGLVLGAVYHQTLIRAKGRLPLQTLEL